jgi:hypothetical protein
MNLWLDDERPCPYPEGWEFALDAQDAVNWIDNNGTPEVCSLDHDLVEEHYPWNEVEHDDYTEPCGCAVVYWMMENSVFPERVIVHTMNVVGAAKMIEKLQEYGYRWRGMVNTPGANKYSWIMERD